MKLFFGLVFLLFSFNSFAKKAEDPLKYTKHHMYSAHKDLYENGMGRIPFTSVKIIPAAPSYWDLGLGMMGSASKESLLLGIDNVGESFSLIKKGSKRSAKFGGMIFDQSWELTKRVNRESQTGAYELFQKSLSAPKSIFLFSLDRSKKVGVKVDKTVAKIKSSSRESSASVSSNILKNGRTSAYKTRKGLQKIGNHLLGRSTLFKDNLKEAAKKTNRTSSKSAKKWKTRVIQTGKKSYSISKSFGTKTFEELNKSGDKFSYLTKIDGESFNKSMKESSRKLLSSLDNISHQVDDTLTSSSKRHFDLAGKSIGTSFTYKGFKRFDDKYSKKLIPNYKKGITRSKKIRDKINGPLLNTLSNSFSNFGSDWSENKRKMDNSFEEDFGIIGLVTGIFKSTGILTKAIFYDSFLKPATLSTVSMLGLGVNNAVIYPSSLILSSAASTALIGTEVVIDSTQTIGDVIVPAVSGVGAVALASSEYLGGKIGGYGVKAIKYPAFAATRALGYTGEYAQKGLGKLVKGGLYSSGRVVQGTGYLYGLTTKAFSYPAAFLTNWSVLGTGKLASGVQYASAYSGSWAISGTGHTTKAIGYTSEKFIRASSFAASKLSKYSILGAGYTASGLTWLGKPITYIIAPTAGALTGASIATLGTASSAAYWGIGKTAALGTSLIGTTGAGVTIAGGAIGSTVYAGGAMAYEAMKGMTLATGALTGGGLLVSYGSVAHVAGHAVLGVGDISYSLISLEFPKYLVTQFKKSKKSDELN
ncbi:MAG: hypothetical protein CME70_04430 [Halobacteriovorax sp.]|nr:hypothetical protein [Halobacteriovorax sp.]|tara:strand:+ start:25117 stop:27396 length:2280 start_codon:yes stop_codon:yes gene_type:complete